MVFNRIRRVKCDETRPECIKCVKWGLKCEGLPNHKRRLSIPMAPLPRNLILEDYTDDYLLDENVILKIRPLVDFQPINSWPGLELPIEPNVDELCRDVSDADSAIQEDVRSSSNVAVPVEAMATRLDEGALPDDSDGRTRYSINPLRMSHN
jgi:hypothetical protein